jgi:2-methylcitrate dehydratase PrpD
MRDEIMSGMTDAGRPVAGGLVEGVLGFAPENLTDALVDKAKTCLADYLSCVLESLPMPWSEQAAALATEMPGGVALAGRGRRVGLQDAAFANAVAGHGLVREDMHVGSVAHLGVVVWPALLAVAAREGVPGPRLLAAAVAGYETGGRLGRAVMSADLARLYRPTGLVGAPAAAMACAHLTNLAPDVALSAFALAVNTASGLNQWPHSGGSEMYFHPGFAARNGLIACELARAGAFASPDILEGEAGFFMAYARRAAPAAIVPFEGGAEILRVFNKEVPACNFAQTPCQAALEAMAQVGHSRRITRIRIEAGMAALRYPGCDATGPFDRPLQAKMSIPFGVAATLARGAIAESNYSALDDTEIARLISVSELVEDPAATEAFPARQASRVVLTLDDGLEVAAALSDVRPASEALIRGRLASVADRVFGNGAGAEILRIVDGIAGDDDAGRRLDAFCARRPVEEHGS